MISACAADRRGDGDGGANANGNANGGTDGGAPGGGSMSCDPMSPDLVGCGCSAVGGSRGCWPSSAPPGARGVGACMDGTQTCTAAGEFPGWGMCTGTVLPSTENCTDGIDNDCNGQTDCHDVACAADPACKTCANGDVRPCYTGPSGTENVGTCKDGMQVCQNNAWPTDCPGQVLPTAEQCTDALDHNCNHLPGCLDVFACATNPACQQQCKLDRSGCVCPKGSGDTATCPAGMVGITTGGSLTTPGTVECCPCTANDCSNAVCCGESVCAGAASCQGYTCKTLPASCNGQVNFDCDDFPEDCDEPCCPCSNCP